MVEREESVVAVAQVVGAEVDAGAVAGGADHQLQHHLRDVEFHPPWWGVNLVPLLLTTLLLFLLGPSSAIPMSFATVAYVWWVVGTVDVISTLTIHGGISRLFSSINVGTRVVIVVVIVRAHTTVASDLLKVSCHSMLTTVLTLSLPRQVVYHFTSESNVCHRVEDGTVGDVITYPHDLPVQACLHSVNVVSLPQPHRHEGGANTPKPQNPSCFNGKLIVS